MQRFDMINEEQGMQLISTDAGLRQLQRKRRSPHPFSSCRIQPFATAEILISLAGIERVRVTRFDPNARMRQLGNIKNA